MALVERTVLDKIEVIAWSKALQIRLDKQIINDETDEVVVSGKWHRYVLHPDQDVSSEPDDIQAVANALWTDEVKAAWAAHLEKVRPPNWNG